LQTKIEIENRMGRDKAHSYYRSKARLLIQNLPKKCMNCSYDKHVECCHIYPISEFDLDATEEEINDPSNIVLLCPNCHWELDNLDLQIKTNVKLAYGSLLPSKSEDSLLRDRPSFLNEQDLFYMDSD
jgi:hypothetical protein